MENYRITRTYSLSAETIEEIKAQAQKAGVSMSRYLEQCVWDKSKRECASHQVTRTQN